MTTWRDQQTVELLDLDIAATPIPLRSSGPKACGHRGPYIVTKRGKHKTKYQEVCCSRPDGHDGNHQRGTHRDGPTHEWSPVRRQGLAGTVTSERIPSVIKGTNAHLLGDHRTALDRARRRFLIVFQAP